MMKKLILLVGILCVLGCITARTGTVIFTERSFTADNLLIRQEYKLSLPLPPGIPDFTTHGEPTWQFEEDYFRMVAYPVQPGGTVTAFTGGYYVLVWVEANVFKPVSIQLAALAPRYWLFDAQGQPYEVQKADLLAVIDHYRQMEEERITGNKL